MMAKENLKFFVNFHKIRNLDAEMEMSIIIKKTE